MAIVYHYTTVSALLGMLSECSAEEQYMTMWATHAFYLNDPTEYKYGKKVCLDTIKEIENELKIPKKERLSNVLDNETFNRALENIEFILSGNTSNKGGVPYIISLSRNADALPMWNTYTKNGNGISIGFDEDSLQDCSYGYGKTAPYDLSTMLEEKYEIKECIYDTLHRNFISVREDFKKEYSGLLKSKNEPNTDDKSKETIAIGFLLRIYKALAPRIKDIAYEYEQEVRFVVRNKDEIHFRESKGMIIPYVKVKIPLKCIKEIVIGPTMDADRTRDSLIMLLYNKGMQNILTNSKEIIKISTKPYR